MLAAERRARILDRLNRDGIVRVSELVDALGVSDMTVRRDLGALQREGLLEKVHGGAVPRSAETSSAEPSFAAKSYRQQRQKEGIAVRAARLVRPGDSIAVSAGTTTYALARHLARVPGLTVVTNSVWVADILHRRGEPSQTVLLTGGLRTPSDALVGQMAIATLSTLHVDLVFLGVHGMDESAGFTTPNLQEAEANRALVASGRRLVVVADSTKWGILGLSTMAPLGAADVVVTDPQLPAEAARQLADQVETVLLADTTGNDHPAPPGGSQPT